MSRSILIHHLSDLHVGKLHLTPDFKGGMIKHRDPSDYRLLDYLQYLETHTPIPDVIVVSGDFASIAAKDEFDASARFLRP